GGVGALLAGITLASRRTVLGLGRWVAWAPGVFGLGLIGFSYARELWLSLPLLAVTGFAFMAHLAASNTILQTIVHDDKRGRVMSLYTMAFLGMAPFGSLLAGVIADELGAPAMVRLGGGGCLVGALLFTLALPRLRASVRPLYVEKGILPQIAAG